MYIKNICVIGAGISGLVTAKTFIEVGYDVTVFEKQKGLGGVWEKSRTYPGLTTQNTRDTFCFSDFPMPESYPEWPTAEDMRNYLQSYAEYFGVTPRINFQTEVTNVSRKEKDNPGWVVKTKGKTGEQEREFDFVFICNGTFSIPKIPNIPGREEFIASGGKILHSTDFNSAEQIVGKRLVVVGFGKSATDVATFAADKAKECNLVFRRAIWKIPRFFLGKLNVKYILLTRFAEAWLPYRQLRGGERLLHTVGKPLVWAFWRTNEFIVRRQLDLDGCGMLPEHPMERVDCTTNIVSESFFTYLRSGKIKAQKTEISRFVPGGVELANGKFISADMVIFGTGFRQDIPFLEPKYRQLLIDQQNNFHLYRHLIHPEIPQMGFVGYNSSFFSQLTSEVGAWWLLEYINGNLSLPSLEQMYAEIQAELDWIQKKLAVSTTSAACIVPFTLRYLDQLMTDMGATSPEPIWQGIPQVMMPVDPLIYGEARRKLPSQTSLKVKKILKVR
ncbi:MAG: NAD(P)/FAD-dependent oxidoreductase [Calothrix sp. MO_192.B10]|nr:NAD(P)/FAD-dependent oxidoreductase [Calothrix sp. MO_192.B10]